MEIFTQVSFIRGSDKVLGSIQKVRLKRGLKGIGTQIDLFRRIRRMFRTRRGLVRFDAETFIFRHRLLIIMLFSKISEKQSYDSKLKTEASIHIDTSKINP